MNGSTPLLATTSRHTPQSSVLRSAASRPTMLRPSGPHASVSCSLVARPPAARRRPSTASLSGPFRSQSAIRVLAAQLLVVFTVFALLALAFSSFLTPV